MMAKITKGSSFGGCVKYVMTKKEAQLIGAKDVLYANHKTVTESFNAQAELNPRLGKKVGHISLNFSVQDRDKVDDAFMRRMAGEYMQKMGIGDTPYIVVRHNDKEHPHCHIVFSRVSNSGKTISDQNDRLRNVKACRDLTEKHGLYMAPGKENVKREQLRNPDKLKYEIYDAIKTALPHCSNWGELRNRLEKKGIAVEYKFKGSTGEKEGVIFSKDGQSFNGSKIDRQFSYSKLDATLNENARRLEGISTPKATPTIEKQPMAPPRQAIEHQSQGYTWPTNDSYQDSHSAGSVLGELFNLPVSNSDYDENEAEFRRQQRKKKKKPQPKLKL